MNGIFGCIGNDINTTDIPNIMSGMTGLSVEHITRSSPAQQLFLYNIKSDFDNYSQNLYSKDIFAAVNGCIYWNNKQLSEVANSEGPAASLIEAYHNLGFDFLKYISGEFSICIYDRNNDKALIAIDQFGIKPLCYTLPGNNSLIFAPTLDSLRQHPHIETKINLQNIYNYIYFHVVPSPSTIYEKVYKLQPAECLIYDNGLITNKIYWQPEFKEDSSFSLSSGKEKLLEYLNIAVKKHHPSTDTGTFLSGGLDSSTVLGMACGINENTNAFSIGFSEQGYDEIEYARLSARHFGSRLHEYYVTPDDIYDDIENIAMAYDEPFGNSSAIPTLYCARLAKQNGMNYMLAGDGGDEIFAGNKRYAKQQLFDMYTKIPVIIRNLIIEPALLKSPIGDLNSITKKIRSYVEQARIKMPDRLETYNYLHHFDSTQVFENDFYAAINPTDPLEQLSRTYNTPAADTNLLNKMLYLDWKFTLADNDLRKVNKMCELENIQVHYPLLDIDLVNFSTTIPSRLKIKNRKLRYFYKMSLEGFLPKATLTKSKHGFGLPFGEWLKTSPRLQEMVYDSIRNLASRDIIKSQFIDKLIDMHRHGHAGYYGTMLWTLAMLEFWFVHHDDNHKYT